MKPRKKFDIKLSDGDCIEIVFEDGGFITSDKAESYLLFSILEKLEEIRCGLIDIETCLPVKE